MYILHVLFARLPMCELHLHLHVHVYVLCKHTCKDINLLQVYICYSMASLCMHMYIFNHIFMSQFVLLMDPLSMRVEWRCITMVNGVQYVIIDGI